MGMWALIRSKFGMPANTYHMKRRYVQDGSWNIFCSLVISYHHVYFDFHSHARLDPCMCDTKTYYDVIYVKRHENLLDRIYSCFFDTNYRFTKQSCQWFQMLYPNNMMRRDILQSTCTS
eukprot:5817010-Pyramimonas_sp.AAC.1